MNEGAPARQAVFLDRDGVINRMVYHLDFGLVDSPQHPDQFELLPGVPEAIRLINEMGLLAIVVSNQPGIAKGKCTPTVLDAVTARMHRQLGEFGAHLDAVYYCLHHPQASLTEYLQVCDCRKPQPGLLMRAVAEFGLAPGSCFMVGDGLTDIQAGKAAGCTNILLGRRTCNLCARVTEFAASPDLYAADLLDGVRQIQSLRNKSGPAPCSYSVPAAGVGPIRGQETR